MAEMRIHFTDLADKSKIRYSTLRGWEQNNRYPRAHETYAIAKALGVSMESLLTGKKQTKSYSNPMIDQICAYMEKLTESGLIQFWANWKMFRATFPELETKI